MHASSLTSFGSAAPETRVLDDPAGPLVIEMAVPGVDPTTITVFARDCPGRLEVRYVPAGRDEFVARMVVLHDGVAALGTLAGLRQGVLRLSVPRRSNDAVQVPIDLG